MLDLHEPTPNDLHNEPRELTVRGPDRQPFGDPPVVLRLVGRYSDRYLAAQRAALLGAAILARAGIENEERAAKRLSERDAGLEVAIACVVDWSGVNREGAPAPCTPENVRRLLRGFPFIRDQVETFIHTERNFSRGVSTTSSPGLAESSH